MNPSEFECFGDPERWRQMPVPVTGLFLSHRHARYVRESLLAAIAQEYPMQLIVSDDGSDDDTAAVVRDVLGDVRTHHQILLRTGCPNLGLVPHINRLLPHAEGQLIVFLSADDVALPGRIEKLADAARQSPEVAVFGSSFEVISDDGGPPSESAPMRPPAPFGLREYLGQSAFKWMPGAVMAFRRSLGDVFGPLPSPLWAEDITLFLRGLMIGKAWFLPDALVRYRIVTGSLSRRGDLYAADVDSVVRAHRFPLARVEGLASALSADVDAARRSGLSDEATLSELERRFVQTWRIEEALHRAVREQPRRAWIAPALRALPVPELRSTALRLIVIAIAPGLFFGLKSAMRRKAAV